VAALNLVQQWRTSTRTGWGKVGTAVLFPAAFFLLLEWQERDYAVDAETVQGEVLEKGASRGGRITYRFSTLDGESFEGGSNALPATWDELQPGSRVTVEYKRDAPGTSRIAGQTTGAGFWWKAAALLGAAGLVLIVIGARKGVSRRIQRR
jgi:hypothetical protein